MYNVRNFSYICSQFFCLFYLATYLADLPNHMDTEQFWNTRSQSQELIPVLHKAQFD